MAKDSTDVVDQHDAAATAVDPVDAPSKQADDKSAEKERNEALETADPNDDLDVARPDEGTEISLPGTVIEAEEVAEPTVKVELDANFTVPVLEAYQDEQGRERGRVKGYEAPTDAKVYSATAEAQGVGEDGYITLPAEVPASVAADLEVSPAVKVVD